MLIDDGVDVGLLASILGPVDEVPSYGGSGIDDGGFDGFVCLVGGGIEMGLDDGA